MTYISELRALIGKRPFVLAGAAVLVLDAARPGEILLHRRADNGLWGTPGGIIDPDESAEMTAVREVAEETGYAIASPQLLTVISGPEVHYIYPNGDEVHNVCILYLAEILADSPVRAADGETLELGWFPFDHLPDDMSPPSRTVLARAAQLPGMREQVYRLRTETVATG